MVGQCDKGRQEYVGYESVIRSYEDLNSNKQLTHQILSHHIQNISFISSKISECESIDALQIVMDQFPEVVKVNKLLYDNRENHELNLVFLCSNISGF